MTQEETSQETAGTAANGEAQAPEALQAALDAANARADEYRNDALRARAELDNVQKLTAREIANAHKYALERFLTDLRPSKTASIWGSRRPPDPRTSRRSARAWN